MNEISRAKPNVLPDSWITALFNKLSAMYGNRFTDMWRGIDPESIKAMWAEKLSVYSADALRYALEQCDTLPWPPTLPEFMAFCKTYSVRVPVFKGLPPPVLSKDEALARLKEACDKSGIQLGSVVKKPSHDGKQGDDHAAR